MPKRSKKILDLDNSQSFVTFKEIAEKYQFLEKEKPTLPQGSGLPKISFSEYDKDPTLYSDSITSVKELE